jgi:glycosyltransferase involved in cell wall biosynthesis
MTPISVVIITFNEEQNIERCLQSIVGIADDIVVLDSYSTDKTQAICEQFNVRFFQHPFSGYIEQKNRALEFAKYPHVFSLDADEVPSAELLQSILKIKENWEYDSYIITRLTNYCGHWVRHCGWYPDRKLRIWDTRKGKWDGLLIHEKVKMEEGCTSKVLEGDLLHYSYNSIDQHIGQIMKFTSIMAQEQFQKNKKPSIAKIIYKPFWKFIRSYILQRGFLDGYAGLVISLMSAYATFVKYIKTKELFSKTCAQ